MSTSILDDGDGLFATHVKLEDVNDIIGEQLNTQSQLEKDTKLTLIGDGNGFSSRVLLVEPKWTLPDDSLPSPFVLKIISCQHLNALIEKAKEEQAYLMTSEQAEAITAHFGQATQKLHNQEMNFYGIVEQLGIRSSLLTPKVYFSKVFTENNTTKGFVGMEYVEGSVVKHVYENSRPEDLHPILKAIAKLQAITFELTDEQKKSIDNNLFRETFGGMVEEHGMRGIYEKTKSMDRCRLESKVEALQQFGKELVNAEVVFNLNPHVGIKQDVLCHGDLWTANILWDSQNKPARVIDFQLTHFGNPAEDFVRFFTCSLSGEDRRNHWEGLLETFYGYYLKELGHKKPMYTLEQLKESYRRFFVVGGLAVLPMFGPVVDLKLMSLPSEVQRAHKETVVRNLECLLEDIEMYHLYSKNK